NTIEAVRKECVRDYYGYLATIQNNKVGHSWIGLALNESVSAFVANNYVYQNLAGLNPKHTNGDFVKQFWGLDITDPTIPWSRFYHNTVYRSSDNHLWLAININPVGSSDPGYMHDVDVRNNIFCGLAG